MNGAIRYPSHKIGYAGKAFHLGGLVDIGLNEVTTVSVITSRAAVNALIGIGVDFTFQDAEVRTGLTAFATALLAYVVNGYLLL